MSVAAIALVLLAARPATARPAGSFPLVAQAVRARRSLCFRARQEIWMSPASPGRAGPAAVRIVADELQDGQRVRMTYCLPPEAAGRVVVDDGHLMHQWERSSHMILLERSREESAAVQRRLLALLHRNYRCACQARASVNGLPCDVVRVSPRLGHAGPSRLLWIERRHHAILRTEEFDAAGVRRYLSFFETFRFIRPPSLRRFSLPAGVRVCRVRETLRDRADLRATRVAAGLPGRLPAWLPDGYALLGCAAGGTGAGRCIVLRFSDGLEMLSVMETPACPAGEAPAPAPAGQQVWERDIPPLHVAVTGDDTLPKGLGQQMLAALEPRGEAGRRPAPRSYYHPHRAR